MTARRARRMAWLLAGIVPLAGLLITNASTGWIERPFLYFPTRALAATPADAGLTYEDVTFVAADGVAIHAWFVPGPADLTVLWFHGNAGNIGDRIERLARWRRTTGASVLLVSYRGYGRSEGRPSERGFYRDADAALGYLRTRSPGPLVYYGQSLGSAVAVELARREPPSALILESTFPSLRSLARHVYAWLPVWPFLHERYDVAARAADIAVPTLVIHGEHDEIAPLAGAIQVHAALAGPAELLVVPGAGHNDVAAVGGAVYDDRIAALLDAPR